MTKKSTVLIIPDDLHDAANDVAEQMGWGTNSYSVPLTNDGATITHYGLHAQSDEQFQGWVTGAIPLPEGMEQAQPVIDALIYSFRDDLFGAAHFAAVLDANGLKRWPLPININTADAATLQTLSGVGEDRAAQIIAGRPWADPMDLTQISGIGEATVARWQDDPGLEV